MTEMQQFYNTNTNFKTFVDKTAKAYGKTVPEVLMLATTYQVYLSYQRGGCNAGVK